VVTQLTDFPGAANGRSGVERVMRALGRLRFASRCNTTAIVTPHDGGLAVIVTKGKRA
jgi:hypothetical protein